jgi:hypothetical protein
MMLLDPAAALKDVARTAAEPQGTWNYPSISNLAQPIGQSIDVLASS